MLTPFLQRKVALAYYRWDQTKDGLVDGNDFELVGRKVAAALGPDDGSSEHDNIVNAYRGLWNNYLKAYNLDPGEALSLSAHLAGHEQFTQHPGAAEFAESTNRPIFTAIDRDGDGRIDQQEWAAFLGALGATEDEAEKAFRLLDRDGDGTVSTQELSVALFEYYNSDDPNSPGNGFFGEG